MIAFVKSITILLLSVVSLAAKAKLMQPKFAICLTGQLARLEVLSKIKNIFVPNVLRGTILQVFVLLDSNMTDVKQTFYKYDYSLNPYANFSAAELKEYMIKHTDRQLIQQGNTFQNAIQFHVQYAPPAQNHYPLLGNRIPVTEKKISGFATVESAASRFQNNMRWMSTLRECVKWVQAEEYKQRRFVNYIVRLRDDSYALAPWVFAPISRYKNNLVSANIGSHHGVNDHNFVIDRRWSDVLYRGITEDYYFNDTLDRFIWLNPEHRIFKIAQSYGINVTLNKVCEQPLLPLRGFENATHWRLHPAYVRIVLDYCTNPDTWEPCCDENFIINTQSLFAPLIPD